VAKHSYLISEGELNAAQLELLTLRDLLRWGFTQFNRADLFYGHGTDNAWDEIIYLTLASLKLGPTLNPAFLAARLTLTERSLLLDRIRQRVNERIPSAYLVKQAYFAGLSFFVDRRVLIPRSPMAELIEQQFSPWISQADHINTILDLGTGSGCIAIACAYAFPEARIDAVDNSKEALAVAAINVATHQLQGQVNLIQSDLFENLSSRLYDIIISNPPYVDEEDLANLPAEYRHEPMAALAAGRDGLDFIIRLLKQALKYLKNNGILMVEVGNSKEALIQRYPQIPFIWLEFERGDAEIFLLTQEQLSRYEQEI
jgi:ribosomal protein L3 glutamine methyltransferase